MGGLTEEQVAKLSPEDQAALGTLELRLLEKRQRLLKRARGAGPLGRLGSVATCILAIVSLWILAEPEQFDIALTTLVFASAIAIEAVNRVTRRQDALMELVEVLLKANDKKCQTPVTKGT